MESPTDTTPGLRTNSLGVGAIAFAVLATLLAIYALGVSLSTRNGTGASVASVDSAASAGEAAPSVEVELTEFAITPAELTVAPGGSLAVTNAGAVEHNLMVKETSVGTADLAGGASENLDLSSLDPGSYDIWCDIPGHESAGMAGTLTIGDGAAAPAAADADDMPGVAHGDTTGGDWQAMYDAMQASVEAFPAATEGTGGQLMEPIVHDDGTKEFVFTLDEMQWEVEPGKVVDGVAYNGQIPGPTVKVDIGDKVRITVNNELDEITSLHPHGVRGHSFEADGVGFVSQDPIAPGESYSADFVADELSVGMYHGHDMGLHQVPNGAVGAFLVGEVPLPEATEIVEERVMMLNDAGNIGFSLDGKSFPATTPYALETGEFMLVHYMNEGLGPHPMHLHGNRQLVVAKDGFPLDSPYYADTINVAPGERYSVLIEAEQAGVWVWHCHILSHVERSDGSMFGMLTALVVTDPESA